ncbi:hypothetical protein ES319_D05G198000v1 [Gossypium barbadense]|uniref:B box-type domain-containing protein n=1 Tax=Gossypium barbadense TaxID=3634 RepID=A0A5J5RK83_GOSBA|nr:hypothetical protein ES319_D05G198000v1 [Gossypium barbadense]
MSVTKRRPRCSAPPTKPPCATPATTGFTTPTSLPLSTNAFPYSILPLQNKSLFAISEKRAFLFCQQDRAILCRDCDVPIHAANEHTKKHNRFLLTGVKLSPTTAIYTSSSSSSVASLSNVGHSVPEFKSQQSVKNSVSASTPILNSTSLAKSSSISTTSAAVTNNKSGGDNLLASVEGGSASSISEYLIETLPGWHVEDFLDSSSPSFGFCKSDDCMLPFLDADLESNMTTCSPESLGLLVPQSPYSLCPPQYSSQMGGQIGLKETNEIIGMKANRRRVDDSFTVPWSSPQSTSSKRSKRLW